MTGPMPAGLALLVAILGVLHPPGRPSGRPIAPRSVGTVVGTLRHKGCPTAPAGATVSVVGREATATADAEGRFQLELPPGTYSIVISGAGLVPGQRVDEVAVTARQTRDLGRVEVWPEERPPGCTSGLQLAPVTSEVVATAPDTPALELPGEAVASAAGGGELWVRGLAGAAPGQFGLQGNPANPDEDALGPASFAVGPSGSLWVLDSLNWRLQRFDARGHSTGSVRLERSDEPPVEADVAVSEEGGIFVFTQSDPGRLAEYEAGGRLLVSGPLPPSCRGVDLLFAGRQRPLLLMRNGQALRADVGWGGIRVAGPLPGLPDGNLHVEAERLDRWWAVLKLSTADGRVRRSVRLHSAVPLTGVRLVGVDRRGEVVLAVDRAEGAENGTPRAEVLLLAIDQHGHLEGTARVPPGGRRFQFREFALAPDGAVVQMQSDAHEIRFVRWALRPTSRAARTGEGIVRGRVVNSGPLRGGASVAIARLRRSVPVAPDGTFELRLPAGTWLISVRHPAAAAEPALEVKVSVAVGAIVDVGTLSLPRAPPPPGKPGNGPRP